MESILLKKLHLDDKQETVVRNQRNNGYVRNQSSRYHQRTRINPKLHETLDEIIQEVSSLSDLFSSFDVIYGMALRQAETEVEQDFGQGTRKIKTWVDQNHIYKVDLILHEDGNWTIFGKRLDLPKELLLKLTQLFDTLRKNEVYVYEHPMGDIFLLKKDFIENGRHIKAISIQKQRFLPNSVKVLLQQSSPFYGGKHHDYR